METPSQPVAGNWARRFFTIWTGQALSLFGSALVQFALIWWLTQKSGSTTVLAIAVPVGMLPQILIGPFAGALVEPAAHHERGESYRRDRRPCL